MQFKLEVTSLYTCGHAFTNEEASCYSGISAVNICIFSSLSILKSVRLIDFEVKSIEKFVSVFLFLVGCWNIHSSGKCSVCLQSFIISLIETDKGAILLLSWSLSWDQVHITAKAEMCISGGTVMFLLKLTANTWNWSI